MHLIVPIALLFASTIAQATTNYLPGEEIVIIPKERDKEIPMQDLAIMTITSTPDFSGSVVLGNEGVKQIKSTKDLKEWSLIFANRNSSTIVLYKKNTDGISLVSQMKEVVKEEKEIKGMSVCVARGTQSTEWAPVICYDQPTAANSTVNLKVIGFGKDGQIEIRLEAKLPMDGSLQPPLDLCEIVGDGEIKHVFFWKRPMFKELRDQSALLNYDIRYHSMNSNEQVKKLTLLGQVSTGSQIFMLSIYNLANSKGSLIIYAYTSNALMGQPIGRKIVEACLISSTLPITLAKCTSHIIGEPGSDNVAGSYLVGNSFNNELLEMAFASRELMVRYTYKIILKASLDIEITTVKQEEVKLTELPKADSKVGLYRFDSATVSFVYYRELTDSKFQVAFVNSILNPVSPIKSAFPLHLNSISLESYFLTLTLSSPSLIYKVASQSQLFISTPGPPFFSLTFTANLLLSSAFSFSLSSPLLRLSPASPWPVPFAAPEAPSATVTGYAALVFELAKRPRSFFSTGSLASPTSNLELKTNHNTLTEMAVEGMWRGAEVRANEVRWAARSAQGLQIQHAKSSLALLKWNGPKPNGIELGNESVALWGDDANGKFGFVELEINANNVGEFKMCDYRIEKPQVFYIGKDRKLVGIRNQEVIFRDLTKEACNTQTLKTILPLSGTTKIHHLTYDGFITGGHKLSVLTELNGDLFLTLFSLFSIERWVQDLHIKIVNKSALNIGNKISYCFYNSDTLLILDEENKKLISTQLTLGVYHIQRLTNLIEVTSMKCSNKGRYAGFIGSVDPGTSNLFNYLVYVFDLSNFVYKGDQSISTNLGKKQIVNFSMRADKKELPIDSLFFIMDDNELIVRHYNSQLGTNVLFERFRLDSIELLYTSPKQLGSQSQEIVFVDKENPTLNIFKTSLPINILEFQQEAQFKLVKPKIPINGSLEVLIDLEGLISLHNWNISCVYKERLPCPSNVEFTPRLEFVQKPTSIGEDQRTYFSGLASKRQDRDSLFRIGFYREYGQSSIIVSLDKSSIFTGYPDSVEFRLTDSNSYDKFDTAYGDCWLETASKDSQCLIILVDRGDADIKFNFIFESGFQTKKIADRSPLYPITGFAVIGIEYTQSLISCHEDTFTCLIIHFSDIDPNIEPQFYTSAYTKSPPSMASSRLSSPNLPKRMNLVHILKFTDYWLIAYATLGVVEPIQFISIKASDKSIILPKVTRPNIDLKQTWIALSCFKSSEILFMCCGIMPFITISKQAFKLTQATNLAIDETDNFNMLMYKDYFIDKRIDSLSIGQHYLTVSAIKRYTGDIDEKVVFVYQHSNIDLVGKSMLRSEKTFAAVGSSLIGSQAKLIPFSFDVSIINKNVLSENILVENKDYMIIHIGKRRVVYRLNQMSMKFTSITPTIFSDLTLSTFGTPSPSLQLSSFLLMDGAASTPATVPSDQGNQPLNSRHFSYITLLLANSVVDSLRDRGLLLPPRFCVCWICVSEEKKETGRDPR